MISPHLARPGFLRDQAILLLLLLWAFLVSCTALSSMDIWWHLRTGQLMLERGSVPLSDWYTYTDPDRPWTDLHWGFQLLVVVLHRLGGVSLLIIKALCVAVAVLFGWLAVRRAPPDECHALCWIPAIVCVSGRSLVRPEMLSLVLLGVSLWMVSRAPTCRTALRWLPLVLLVWVNCHGLFVLGLVVFACLAIDVFMPLRFRGPLRLAEPSATGVDRATVVRMAAVCVAACLANPYFEEGALFPLQLYHKFSVDRALYAGVGEFQRPIEFVRRYGLFSNVYLVSEAALWLATALSFVPAIRQRRLSLTRLLMFAAFSHLAWIASRNTGVFALVSAVVLSSNLGEGRVVRDPTVGIARYGRCASAIVLVALSVGHHRPLGKSWRRRPVFFAA